MMRIYINIVGATITVTVITILTTGQTTFHSISKFLNITLSIITIYLSRYNILLAIVRRINNFMCT